MRILTLETSTKDFSLAITENGKVKVYQHIKLKRVLSNSIIPAIDALCKKAKIPFSHLDGFAIGLGPGSFTSLRVGLSTVKAFCCATNKPIVGISSLDALALNHRAKEDIQICVLCDAKRNLLYSCLYEQKDGKLKRTSDYLLVDLLSLLKKIKKKTLFIGDGIGLFQDEIIKTCEKKSKGKSVLAVFALPKDWYPKASHLALLADKRFRSRKFNNLDKLKPIYLYPDDCQVRR